MRQETLRGFELILRSHLGSMSVSQHTLYKAPTLLLLAVSLLELSEFSLLRDNDLKLQRSLQLDICPLYLTHCWMNGVWTTLTLMYSPYPTHPPVQDSTGASRWDPDQLSFWTGSTNS